MSLEIKALKRVVNDLEPIYQTAKILRDSPINDEERIEATKTLCDLLSVLANGLTNYLEVIQTLHISRPLDDFMRGLHVGQKAKSNANNP